MAGLPLALNTHLTSDSGSRCAVTPERKVACWGSASAISRGLGNIFGFLISSATLVPDLENVQFVTSGRMSSCAVMENSTVKCWGEFSAISESLTSLSGVIFPELQGMQSLSWDPFTALACSLMNNLTVSCWGRGTALIFQNDSALPAQNPYSLGAKFLSGSCMINSTNQVACWDSYSSQVRMIAGISNATTIASNRTGGCGIVANGDVYCWGFNSYGNLGNNTTVASTAAIKVNNIANAVHVAYNVSATCVILNGGNVKCWGSQFGLVPTDVPSLNGSTALSVSNIGVCGVNGIDTVKCLQAFRADAPVVNIANTTGAISISNGVHHSCSKLSNGQIACWGVNSYGQLGNLPLYTEYDSNAPTKVSAVIIPTSKPVREVYADLYATVLSHTDGTVTKFGQKVPFVYRPSAILKSY